MLGRLLRCVLACGAALLVAACPRGEYRPGGGNWRFDARANPVAGTLTTTRLYIASYNFNASKIDYTQLELLCFKGAPTVRLQFPARVGGETSAALSYRFDDKPQRHGGRFVGTRTVVLEDRKEVEAFLGELSTARTVSFNVNSLIQGNAWARFAVEGAPQAIEAAYAACPLGKAA